MCRGGAGVRRHDRVFAVLVVAATIGVISPSGNEVGPFLAVEQASLAQTVVRTARGRGSSPGTTSIGSFATAAGRAAGGGLAAGAHPRLEPARRRLPAGDRRLRARSASRWPALFRACRPRVEVPPTRRDDRRSAPARAAPLARYRRSTVGALRARRVRRRLRHAEPHRATGSSVRFGVDPAVARRHPLRREHPGRLLGAGRRPLAGRFGLVDTMVFTHLPSNVLLIAGAAHAHPAAGDRRPAGPLLDQPDGRARPASRTRWPSSIPTSDPRRPA